MKRPIRPLVVEHVRRRGRRPAEPPSAPLPEPVLTALAAIADDLRHLPRGCIGDTAELLHWLRRMAGRVDGVGRMTIPGRVLEIPTPLSRRSEGMVKTTTPFRTPPRDLHNEDTPSLSGHALADAVFGKGLKISEPPVEGTQSVSTPANVLLGTSPRGTYNLRTSRTRTVTSRRGRTIPVEVRRSRSATQLEMLV